MPQLSEPQMWHCGARQRIVVLDHTIQNIKLNAPMHILSGTLRPTPLPWLPVVSNILPPHLMRDEATAKLLRNFINNDRLSLCDDIVFHPNLRLPSRQRIWLNQPAE